MKKGSIDPITLILIIAIVIFLLILTGIITPKDIISLLGGWFSWRLVKKEKKKIVDFVSIVLILVSLLIFLYIITYYQTYSPEFLTHQQFYNSIVPIAVAFFSGFLGMWIKISDKLSDFEGRLGKLEGKLDQYIKNHSKSE